MTVSDQVDPYSGANPIQKSSIWQNDSGKLISDAFRLVLSTGELIATPSIVTSLPRTQVNLINTEASTHPMDREFISKTSIAINAPVAKVWDALINPDVITQYFFGAEVVSGWKEGSPITFRGEYQGNKYEEKGVLLHVKPESLLQYTHWSNFDELPDAPENYRTWTFRLSEEDTHVLLSITEDNIPTEEKRERSDEFWTGVLATIKQLLET